MENDKVATPLQRSDWLTALFLFVTLSSLYFATTSGITSSNDGSHYALTRSMVENRAFTLNQFDDYAEGNDIALVDGRLYSDRPPGTALLGTLFYTIGGFLPPPLTPLPSRHDAENPRLLYVMLLPVWAGAGTVVLLFLFMRQLGLPSVAAFTAVFMLALGTTHWKYSTVLFSHTLSAFLVMLSIWLAVRLVKMKQPPRAWYYLGLGVVLGFSVLVEYSNVLLVLVVSGYLVWGVWHHSQKLPSYSSRPFDKGRVITFLFLFIGGGLLSALFLAYYNDTNFGNPFTLSYAYAVNYPWAGNFRSTFDFPLAQGLQAILIWGGSGGWCNDICYNQGLFLLSPLFLLALPGLFWYGRRMRGEFFLTTLLFVIYLLLFARHRTLHGFTADGRYLVPFYSLLMIPLGFTLVWAWSQQNNMLRQLLLPLAIYSLFFLSIRNIFLHIGLSYNYALDFTQLTTEIASPQNWHYLGQQVFRNSGNLPLLWLLELIILLLWIGYQSVWRRKKAKARKMETL